MASAVNTRTIDHFVHLTPPGSVEEVSERFRALGFTVVRGGTHADGLTANALVLLQDGSYLELISFTHPLSHYPPGSEDRAKRENHRWANKSPGWIDYAFLGTGSREPGKSITSAINERAEARKDVDDVRYLEETDGGRLRPDGVVLKWLISAPSNGTESRTTGVLPFFCGDVTPRNLRVPEVPESNRQHRSTAQGIAYVEVVALAEGFELMRSQLVVVIGREPDLTEDGRVAWVLDTPTEGKPDQRPKLILTLPVSEDQKGFASSLAGEGGENAGIFEVAFFVQDLGDDSPEGERTPYGRIQWVRA